MKTSSASRVESVAHHRFRLIDESGTDLGPLASKRASWNPGDTLTCWHGDQLTIIQVVEAEPHEPFHAYLVVRPATETVRSERPNREATDSA